MYFANFLLGGLRDAGGIRSQKSTNTADQSSSILQIFRTMNMGRLFVS